MSIYNEAGYQVQEEVVKHFEHLLSEHTQNPNLGHVQVFRELTQQSKD